MSSETILRIVKERLLLLDLAQIPKPAEALLAEKLLSRTRDLASRSITPKAVTRAILRSVGARKAPTQRSVRQEATEPDLWSEG